MARSQANFTLFNEKIIPITAPTVVVESGTHVTVVGGKAYFFDDDGHEIHVSKDLKLAYQYENTVIMQATGKGDLYHLVIKEDKKPAELKLKHVSSYSEETEDEE